jgi:hypothetical protein
MRWAGHNPRGYVLFESTNESWAGWVVTERMSKRPRVTDPLSFLTDENERLRSRWEALVRALNESYSTGLATNPTAEATLDGVRRAIAAATPAPVAEPKAEELRRLQCEIVSLHANLKKAQEARNAQWRRADQMLRERNQANTRASISETTLAQAGSAVTGALANAQALDRSSSDLARAQDTVRRLLCATAAARASALKAVRIMHPDRNAHPLCADATAHLTQVVESTAIAKTLVSDDAWRIAKREAQRW